MDLERFCSFYDDDLSVVGRRRGIHNRLGFAVQRITVRIARRFLTDPLAVPWPVVESLAGQLGIADACVLGVWPAWVRCHLPVIAWTFPYPHVPRRDLHPCPMGNPLRANEPLHEIANRSNGLEICQGGVTLSAQTAYRNVTKRKKPTKALPGLCWVPAASSDTDPR
ncbi:DUF4158 domain-containing protein [Arthrobacter sp. AQ5-05]|uniref:DUF4158 domain-containing protein n=1 Tax=Arthrobacter sp. AQ5-05 TaxID=2184581 RepID=UPI0018A721AA